MKNLQRPPAGLFASITVIAATTFGSAASAQGYFNTVKTKLENGEQVVGGTVSSPDVDIYCVMGDVSTTGQAQPGSWKTPGISDAIQCNHFRGQS